MTKTRKASATKASALVTIDVDEDANMSQSDKFQKRWDIMFAKLESYSKKFGDCLVPVRWKQDPSLGKWVSRQRDGHNAKFLTEERKARLNAIGFVWRCKDYNNLYPQSKGEKAQFKRPQVVPVVATTTTKTRNTRASVVKKDGARTATAAVAKNKPTKKKIPVAKKRTVTKAPKPTTRAAKVCPIRPAPDNSKNAKKKAPTKANKTTSTRNGGGPHQSQTVPNNNYQRVVPADQGEWVHQYEKLVHYKSRHGHTRFPRPYTADPLLGAWVRAQCLLWHRNALSKERKVLLEAVKLDFDQVIKASNSNDGKNAAVVSDSTTREPEDTPEEDVIGVAPLEENGAVKEMTDEMADDKTSVVTPEQEEEGEDKAAEDDSSLDNVVGRRGKLSLAKKNSDTEKLLPPHNNFGELFIPTMAELSDDDDDESISSEAKREKEERIMKERREWEARQKEQLEKDWDLVDRGDKEHFESKWQEQFAKLCRYHDRFGGRHNGMPADIGLRSWLETQRDLWRNGFLSLHRQHKLMSIGFDFSPLLSEKQESEGSLLLPGSQQTLECSQWLSGQRPSVVTPPTPLAALVMAADIVSGDPAFHRTPPSCVTGPEEQTQVQNGFTMSNTMLPVLGSFSSIHSARMHPNDAVTHTTKLPAPTSVSPSPLRLMQMTPAEIGTSSSPSNKRRQYCEDVAVAHKPQAQKRRRISVH